MSAPMKTLIALLALAASAAHTIEIRPFSVTIPTLNFPISRAALTLECAEIFEPTELSVVAGDNGSYQVGLTSAVTIDLPADAPACFVSMVAFTTLPNEIAARVDSVIYGSAIDVQGRDIAADIESRLTKARIDAKVLEDYPYIDASFQYDDNPALGFCLRVLGQHYQNPFPNSRYLSIYLGEMVTTDGKLAGQQLGAGFTSGIYLSCNEGDRSLEIEMADPAAPLDMPSDDFTTYRATFNDDLTEMTLNNAVWTRSL